MNYVDDLIDKLKNEGYVVLPPNTGQEMKNKIIENVSDNQNIIIELLGNREVLYNNNTISIELFNDLFDLLSYLSRLIKNNKGIVFRGHSNANYHLVSSLLRGKPEKESDYYFDIIKAFPERFKDAKYHLDFLKVMQHYGAETRILDISTNFLAPIYFAVEDAKEENNHFGELILFDKGKHESNVKRLNSDTVEILASLAALDNGLKEELKEKALEFKNINFENNTMRITLFNEKEVVEKLVHEVGQVRLNFSNKINPEHLLGVYFSDSTFDNERITNQAGEFIIHGLIREEELRKKLNEFRFRIKDDKKLIILIDRHAKKQIKKDLELLRVMESTIYPSLPNTIKDIYKK